MAPETAMQGASGQRRDSFPQTPRPIIQWQQGLASKLDDHGFLDWREHAVARRRGPIGASWVVVRLCHLATVLGFSLYCSARIRVLSFDAWSSARTGGVRALP